MMINPNRPDPLKYSRGLRGNSPIEKRRAKWRATAARRRKAAGSKIGKTHADAWRYHKGPGRPEPATAVEIKRAKWRADAARRRTRELEGLRARLIAQGDTGNPWD